MPSCEQIAFLLHCNHVVSLLFASLQLVSLRTYLYMFMYIRPEVEVLCNSES